MIPVLLAIIRAVVLLPLAILVLLALADAGLIEGGPHVVWGFLLLVCGFAADIVYHTFKRNNVTENRK